MLLDSLVLVGVKSIDWDSIGVSSMHFLDRSLCRGKAYDFDTTAAVLRVQFPSNLVIYDTTPDESLARLKLENITRLFIGLQQDYDR